MLIGLFAVYGIERICGAGYQVPMSKLIWSADTLGVGTLIHRDERRALEDENRRFCLQQTV